MKIGRLCGLLLVVGLLAGCTTFQQAGHDMQAAGRNMKQDFSKAGPAMKDGFAEMGRDMKSAAGETKESLKETFR